MEKNDSNKEQMINYLRSAIKTLEENVGYYDEIIENTDASNGLCWAIESIFLHGMKNTKPNRDFWLIIKRYAHKSTVDSIKNFNQIRNDIGRCRSWVRMSINEWCLESYVSCITNDISTATRYYSPHAFLLDTKAVNSAVALMQDLSKHRFKLSCNSTVLNQWNQPPLQLAGIISADGLKWPHSSITSRPKVMLGSNSSKSPPGSCSSSVQKFLTPNSLGILNGHLLQDNGPSRSAENLNLKFAVSEAGLLKSISIPNSLDKDVVSVCSSISHPDFADQRQEFYRTVYDISESEEDDGNTLKRSAEEDELKFRQIIQHNLDKFPLNYDKILSSSSKADEELLQHFGLGLTPPIHSYDPSVKAKEPNNLQTTNPPDVMITRATNSSENSILNKISLEEQADPQPPCLVSSTMSQVENSKGQTEGELNEENVWEISDSRDTLIRSSSGDDGLITVAKIIESVTGRRPSDIAREEHDKTRDIKKSKRHCLHEATKKDIDIYNEYTSIKHEKGLSSQCFQCKSCSAPIGVFFGKERICTYDRCYYCPHCLDKDEAVIPCKVVCNWDFRPYKVSKKNQDYLRSNKTLPLINFEKINPSLYDHVPALNNVKLARLKLKYLRVYLLACNLDHVVKLHSYLNDVTYYSENIDIYSMEDLLKVPSGQLLSLLNAACQFGVNHVYSCHLCSQKGFYCEICRAGGVIYPFDLDNTVRCDSCKAVYHKKCKTSGVVCPKCQRRAIKNSDLSDASSSEFDCKSDYDPKNSINYTYPAAVRR